MELVFEAVARAVDGEDVADVEQSVEDGRGDHLVAEELAPAVEVRLGYFEALALKTADVTEHRSLYDAAGINRLTAQSYDHLLMNLFVLEQVPAWFTNRLKRLVKAPKRYLA
jgi:hypothetical protein